jgi:hypothetical protein
MKQSHEETDYKTDIRMYYQVLSLCAYKLAKGQQRKKIVVFREML